MTENLSGCLQAVALPASSLSKLCQQARHEVSCSFQGIEQGEAVVK